jgi:hypothetical protein
MGEPTPEGWIPPAEKYWDIWVSYCEKVGRWYWTEPCAPELEPYGMNPPCEAIVKGTLYAAGNWTACRRELDKVIEVLKDHSGGKGIGIPHLYAGSIVIENEMLQEKVRELEWKIRRMEHESNKQPTKEDSK